MTKYLLAILIITPSLTSAIEYKAATAKIKDLEGQTIGQLYFKEKNKRIDIAGSIRGLKKNSNHGMHIHENGTCVGDFKAAGSHYDPSHEKKHGYKSETSHFGDLGNIYTNSKGVAEFTMKSNKLFIDVDKFSIIGRSVVVHAKSDDGKSQPSGASGKRIACGVINGVKK